MTKHARILRSTAVGVAAAIAVILLSATPALAAKPAGNGNNPPSSHGGGSSTPTGNDISWPQCGGTFPSGQAFGIVGVNGGLANDPNPCLGLYGSGAVTTSELYWATRSSGTTTQPKASLYVNTADPGNAVTDWPSSGTTPDGTCTTVSGNSIGQNSNACAWQYGYNKASQDGSWLTGAAASVNSLLGSSGTSIYASPSAYPWWLDIETGNTWQSGTNGLAMNVADIQGMLAGLASFGSMTYPIGIYSTSSQWGTIVGAEALGSISGLPDWIPGARTLSGATKNCGLPTFTNGTVAVTQWFGSPYDGDYSCSA